MRSFWIIIKTLKGVLAKHLIWTGPKRCPKISHYPLNYKKIKTTIPRLTNDSERGVYPFSSFQGSITVEAAFSLPLFLAFSIQLISIIYLFQIHSVLTAALHQEVSALSLQMYALDMVGSGFTGADVLDDIYLKEKVINRAGRNYLNQSMIKGGSGGIHITPQLFAGESGIQNQDMVGVLLTYQVEPLLDLLGFSGFTMACQCKMKAWTGYELPPDEVSAMEDIYVYVTENGTVYHTSRNCTYLSLSTRVVDADSIPVLRNDSGEKYYPCELCGDISQNQIFLTEQGNRYHSSVTCSGLKRTVRTVKLSEAGGKGPCSRCVGTG